MTELPPIESNQISPRKKSSLSAKAASIICPGLGQLLEKRYVAGLGQLSIFIVSFSYVLIVIGRWYWNVISVALSDSQKTSPHDDPTFSAPWISISAGLTVCMVVYIWSIVDAGK